MRPRPSRRPPVSERFSTSLARNARLVLATNAPEIGVDHVLDLLDAADHLGERHFSLGKPAGLAAVIAEYLADGPVLAVGDIWANDLAPAAELGADTALVGFTAHGGEPIPHDAWDDPRRPLRRDHRAGPRLRCPDRRRRTAPANPWKGMTDMRKTLMAPGLLAVAAFALVGCSTSGGTSAATGASSDSSSSAASAAWPSSITLALIPNEQVNDLVTSAAPLTDYLSKELGITVTGVVTKDYQAAVEAICAGQAQIAIADAGSLAAAQDQCGAFPVLQDVRYGASSYASEFFTNVANAGKYCTDSPVEATYAANGEKYLYCNGVASGDTNKGVGPIAVDALKKITPGTKVAFGNTTSPAGYQLPVLALESQGIKIDDLDQVPVTGNDNLIMAVYNGDAEVGFAYWDARSAIKTSEVPDIG